MTDINADYDTLVAEMESKVALAVKLLAEATAIYKQIDPVMSEIKYFDSWDNLKKAVEPFFSIPEDSGWSSSSWCSGG
jgi:hypothetical protein